MPTFKITLYSPIPPRPLLKRFMLSQQCKIAVSLITILTPKPAITPNFDHSGPGGIGMRTNSLESNPTLSNAVPSAHLPVRLQLIALTNPPNYHRYLLASQNELVSSLCSQSGGALERGQHSIGLPFKAILGSNVGQSAIRLQPHRS